MCASVHHDFTYGWFPPEVHMILFQPFTLRSKSHPVLEVVHVLEPEAYAPFSPWISKPF
jgi:hypothetical protein